MPSELQVSWLSGLHSLDSIVTIMEDVFNMFRELTSLADPKCLSGAAG